MKVARVPDDFEAFAAQMDAESGDMPMQPEGLPTPFSWVDPALIPPRPGLYGRHYLRKQVSVTVAPGGLGKSSLTIVEAVAMASGRPLLASGWRGPLRSGFSTWRTHATSFNGARRRRCCIMA